MSGSEGGSPAAPEPKPEGNPARTIEIILKDEFGGEAFFEIRATKKLGEVFDAYCPRQAIKRTAVRFLLDGIRIQKTDTPEGLEMENGDTIEAFLEQLGGATPEPAAKSGTKAEDEVPEHISIKVKDQSNNEIFFKIKRSTPLKKVFDAYCKRHEIDTAAVRFLFDGERLQRTDTPDSREMDEGDCIEVFLEQTGGGDGDGEEEVKSEGAPKPKQITIKVKDASNDEVTFKIKRTTVLKKLMDSYHSQKGATPNTLRFFTPDGHRVLDTDTPESLDLEEGELLDVQMQQQGGGGFDE